MDNLPSLSETVRQYGLAANKKLGQHFLLDMNITDKIARLATPFSNVSVAEIGPGPGGLTRALIMAGAKDILAIEMDERFMPALEDISMVSGGKITIVHGDALRINIADHLSGNIKIVANLPYNVGTKLLINWLTSRPLFWSQAVLMFQKEVAERVVAEPGQNAYGRLAVLSQSVCDCHISFDIPASAFSPPPKVDSAVVVLTPKPANQIYPDLKLLGQVTQAAFGQRRKMLRKSLKSMASKFDTNVEDWLGAANIEPTKRPETLSVKEFQDLTNYIRR